MSTSQRNEQRKLTCNTILGQFSQTTKLCFVQMFIDLVYCICYRSVLGPDPTKSDLKHLSTAQISLLPWDGPGPLGVRYLYVFCSVYTYL